ncbi:MAG: hypothetical protein SFY80_15660 [Verrucomicrobiota bacterium]|nr:hypothetical protein [Verrucomicrobiota bacterium]
MKTSQTTAYGYSSLILETTQAELIVPVEVGPRVLHCGLKGGPNLFSTLPEMLGKTGEDSWQIRGGHRLWHSPEHPVRTYAPDNSPISVDTIADGNKVVLKQHTEKLTGIAKTVTIEGLNETTFKVTHTLENLGLWPIELSVWALSVMAHGGYAIVPFAPKGQHPRDLLPNYSIVPWTYTDLSLPVWQMRRDYLGIDVSQAKVAQKLGLSAGYPGWSAYWQQGGTFVKYSPVCPGATYPDLGCAFETFCNDWMIELETLSPLTKLAPGESVSHIEYWGILANLEKPSTAAAYGESFLPAIEKWLATVQK